MISPSRTRHQQALDALHQGHEDEALAHFEEARRIDPANPALLLDQARLLNCLYRFKAARGLLAGACAAMPDEGAVCEAAAGIAMAGRAPELALAMLARFPVRPSARFAAAGIHERLGEIEQAKEALAAAERLGGEKVEGRFLAARLAAREGRHEAVLQILDALRRAAAPQPWTLARIHYARGHAMDALGDPDGAFRGWLAAKEFLKPLAGKLLEESDSALAAREAMVAALTPNEVARWRDQAPIVSTPGVIFLTGYPRSGTTLVEHLLERHSGVPSADENQAFRDLVWRHLDPEQPETSRGHLAAYRSALLELSAAPADTPRVIDKNPQLLPVLPTLLRLMPRMPVIHVMRDPRDVALSCFGMAFGLNHHSVHYLSFETTVRHLTRVRQIAERLRDLLGGQWIDVRYEAVVDSPELECDRIARALGGSGSVGTASARVSYSPTYAEVGGAVNRKAVGRWCRYERHLGPWLEGLAAIGDG